MTQAGSGIRVLFEGVKRTLETLKLNGAALFLVTNKPQFATLNLMKEHGMTGLFTEMLSRNSREPVYATKGEMLLDLAARHGVSVDSAVMVGDTAEDHHAATEAGMRFAFVEYGYGEIGSDVECERISQFADLANVCGSI